MYSKSRGYFVVDIPVEELPNDVLAWAIGAPMRAEFLRPSQRELFLGLDRFWGADNIDAPDCADRFVLNCPAGEGKKTGVMLAAFETCRRSDGADRAIIMQPQINVVDDMVRWCEERSIPGSVRYNEVLIFPPN